jgi:CheY-like chemotaxis protein
LTHNFLPIKNENSREDSLEGLKILVVDDDLLNQTVYKKNLISMDANVTISTNGRDALKILENADFDIILMDINMPIMGGFEATQKIRQLDGTKSTTPIIAISADNHPQIKDKILEAGMNDFLPKHCTNQFLMEKIKFHLNNEQKCTDY